MAAPVGPGNANPVNRVGAAPNNILGTNPVGLATAPKGLAQANPANLLPSGQNGGPQPPSGPPLNHPQPPSMPPQ